MLIQVFDEQQLVEIYRHVIYKVLRDVSPLVRRPLPLLIWFALPNGEPELEGSNLIGSQYGEEIVADGPSLIFLSLGSRVEK
ncbi:MAG: hypothetical protein IRY83_14015 [Chloroflexi bacterium]|nr:hypothetical protein [Chloroflexota bacterium]